MMKIYFIVKTIIILLTVWEFNIISYELEFIIDQVTFPYERN